MEFNSFGYIFVFLPITVFLYILFRGNVIGKIIVFTASCIFYGWNHPWYLLPMFFTAGLDFVVANMIFRSSDERRRKLYLITSISANLALMATFKYTGWATQSLMALGSALGFTLLTRPIFLPLPAGISFYTFESISYTIDVYKKEFTPKKKLLDYFSFIVFFPHLVAGPIRRAKDLLPALSEYRNIVTPKQASLALFYILWGIFLKTVIADNCGGMVEFIADQLHVTKSLPAGMGAVFAYAFSAQIYCDFAAYSLIARGSAQLFNIDVQRNFLTPYFAHNPSDFWERWHISFSKWLRDYLYIPLGGNQHGVAKTLRNLVITMALGGLWHGAGALFIAWGLYHGLLLVVYRVFPIDKYIESILGAFAGRIVSTFLFFHLVVLGWMIFRSTPEQFPILFSSALRLGEATVADLHYPGRLLLLILAPLAVTEFLGFLGRCEFPDLWARIPAWLKVPLALITLYGIIQFGSRQASEFIYFAF